MRNEVADVFPIRGGVLSLLHCNVTKRASFLQVQLSVPSFVHYSCLGHHAKEIVRIHQRRFAGAKLQCLTSNSELSRLDNLELIRLHLKSGTPIVMITQTCAEFYVDPH